MTFSGSLIAMLLLLVYLLFAYSAYRIAMRLAPSFFAAHDAETAIMFVMLLVALMFAVFG